MPGFGNTLMDRKFESLKKNIEIIPSNSHYLVYNYTAIPEIELTFFSENHPNLEFISSSATIAERFIEFRESHYLENHEGI
jgi:hypothetical protein